MSDQPAEPSPSQPSTSNQPEQLPSGFTDEDKANAKAAAVIQKHYRGHKTRQEHKAGGLSSEGRWADALQKSKGIANERDANAGKNTPKERWHRGLHAAIALQNGDAIDSATTASTNPGEEKKNRKGLEIKNKTLQEQHWLEMVDGKHRYGSSLKYYHAKWQESDTKDNFFRWLDHGPGKELSLPECSREQLEKERIVYLNAEQRLNYLVTISRQDGKIRWHSGLLADQLVDTAPRKYEDAGQGRGIVPLQNVPKEDDDQPSAPGSEYSSDSSSSDEDEVAAHYATAETESKGPIKSFFSKFSPSGLGERMLRKTIKHNTWIYVNSLDGNLFVGLKKTGSFQHSSFLSGGRVTSAGIITVQHGVIRSLSPLSGHYRTNIDHFRAFLEDMEERGADLSHVKVKKAEAMLLGLEKYGAFTKKEKTLKEKIFHPQKAKRKAAEAAAEEADNRKNEPASSSPQPKSNAQSLSEWKRDLFYGRKGGARNTSNVKAVREAGQSERVTDQEREGKKETDGQRQGEEGKKQEGKGEKDSHGEEEKRATEAKVGGETKGAAAGGEKAQETTPGGEVNGEKVNGETNGHREQPQQTKTEVDEVMKGLGKVVV